MYRQTQMDTYKLLSEMACRQPQDEFRADSVDEALANIQVTYYIYVQFILYTLHHYHHRSRPSHHTIIKFIRVAKEGGIGSVLLISKGKMYATSFKKKILQFTLYFTLWL